jgi:hypothetical protein
VVFFQFPKDHQQSCFQSQLSCYQSQQPVCYHTQLHTELLHFSTNIIPLFIGFDDSASVHFETVKMVCIILSHSLQHINDILEVVSLHLRQRGVTSFEAQTDALLSLWTALGERASGRGTYVHRREEKTPFLGFETPVFWGSKNKTHVCAVEQRFSRPCHRYRHMLSQHNRRAFDVHEVAVLCVHLDVVLPRLHFGVFGDVDATGGSLATALERRVGARKT